MTEGDKTIKAENPDFTETIKLAFEVMKQLTTLNAGSIVVIGTFLSDIFPTDKQGTLTTSLYIKLLIGAAFFGFGASLILSVVAMIVYRRLLEQHIAEGLNPVGVFTLESTIILMSLASFTGALICFGTAVLLNLFFGS